MTKQVKEQKTKEIKKPKFPKFIGHLHSKGLDMKTFTQVLNNKGYDYGYHTVRRKLNGETSLDFEDIIIFAKSVEVDESIFFN